MIGTSGTGKYRVRIVVAATVCAVVATLVGCSGAEVAPETPEAAVQELLELRSQNTTEPSAYLSFVTTSVAGVLAADSAQRERDEEVIPEWKTPVRSGESSSVAEVTVDWLRSSEHTGWPDSTLFVVQQVDGRWIVVDAVDDRSSGSADSTPAP